MAFGQKLPKYKKKGNQIGIETKVANIWVYNCENIPKAVEQINNCRLFFPKPSVLIIPIQK